MSAGEAAAGTEPTFAQTLTEALPDHAHRSGGLLDPASWAWSTPAGVWSVTGPGLFGSGWQLAGPGGKWVVDADRVLPVLWALGAIQGGPVAGGAS